MSALINKYTCHSYGVLGFWIIIEVAEIYNDVKVEKVNLENEKSGEKEKQDSRQERMQDEACKGDFEDMSADERAVSCAVSNSL